MSIFPSVYEIFSKVLNVSINRGKYITGIKHWYIDPTLFCGWFFVFLFMRIHEFTEGYTEKKKKITRCPQVIEDENVRFVFPFYAKRKYLLIPAYLLKRFMCRRVRGFNIILFSPKTRPKE